MRYAPVPAGAVSISGSDDLMNGVIDCHERLMAGPEDPPLDDKVDFDDAKAETFWSSYEDPTAGLIGQLPRA